MDTEALIRLVIIDLVILVGLAALIGLIAPRSCGSCPLHQDFSS
ncbi:MAG: hypothetical protein NWQ10_07430 [Candidatus Nanopelagicales bacterium]|jgi:hypothetical protein|nr:hypothetical protein [Candidatus Nanopelagicales bacterium]MDP4714570.1 hypothetical protein [Candidatus Nanopelagicales bacterium]MDP4975451.1 hypothetical protein [Candidatus Nanopelagicales bacterium]